MIRYMLKRSMEEKRPITIIYESDGMITQRNIRVREIEEDMVKAYCLLRKQVRFFKIESILSAQFPKPKNDRKIS